LFKPPQKNTILCRDKRENNPDTPKDDTYWTEWQADNFAGALLMPKQVMLAEISERWPKNALPHKQATAWRYVKEELAKVGRVSMQALNIRLKNLGLQDENECYLGNYW
jgi:Zn-dependent peptidase ImmA (M78 family)